MMGSYAEYFEMQKNMFAEWEKYTQATGLNDFAKNTNFDFKPAEFFNKMTEETKKYNEKVAEQFEEVNKFWTNIGQSYKSYETVYDLWKELNKDGVLEAKDAVKIYELWVEKNLDFVKTSFIPNFPVKMQEYCSKVLDNINTASKTSNDFAKSWAESEKAFKDAFSEFNSGDAKSYVEYLESFKKSYDDTIGKFMNGPTFGKDMEFWKAQNASFDKFVKYNIASSKFNASMQEIAKEATEQVVNDFVNMSKDGTQPKTYDEFYKYWAKKVSKAYEQILLTDHFGKLSGEIVDSMSKFKMESDKLFEMYVANTPLVTKSEMDSLHKTVYDLKKEVRSLKAELKKIKTSTQNQTN